MKQKYVEGIELINEEKYHEAYDFFSNILKDDINDVGARYYRSIIDFFYLRRSLRMSYEDMKIVSEKGKRKAKINVYPLLCVLAEEFDEYDNVLYYGSLAHKANNEFKNTLYPTMGRACYLLGIQKNNDSEYFLRAYDYFFKALELFPDDKIDLYKSLTDVCYRLDYHKECLDFTQKLMSLGINDGILYFYRGVCQLYLAEEKEDYEDSLYNLEKALNFMPDDEESLYFKALALAHLGQDALSDSMLMDLYNKEKNQSILSGMFHLYTSKGEYSKIINFPDMENVLKNVSNKFYLARILDFYGNEEERILGMKYYKELFKETKEIEIFQLIFGAYAINNDYKSMIEYCDSILSLKDESYPNNYIKESKAQCFRLTGDEYLKQKEILVELKDKGMFREEYLYFELYINPNRNYKELNKLFKGKFFKMLDTRMVCSILLYGDYPIKKNHKYVLKNVMLLKEEKYHSCNLTLLGRINELINHNYSSAFDYYKKAYELIYEHCNDYCNCAAAFYAHALYNDFNNTINYQESKSKCYEIIKREIKKKHYRNSPNVHFLYAYFALKGVEGFNIKEAIKMLEISRYDSLYDLDGLYLLMKCYEDIDLNKSSQYLKIFYETLNITSQLQKEYYLDKMKDSKLDDDEVIYPFLNNR